MPVLLSPVTLGGYPLPIGTKVMSHQIDNTIQDVPMLGRNGTIGPRSYDGPQLVVLSIDIGVGSYSGYTGSALLTPDDVKDELNRIYALLKSGYVALSVGDIPARFMMVQKQKSTVAYYDSTFRSAATLTVTMYAQDTRWQSNAVNSATTVAGISQDLTGAGTDRAYPRFTFHGTAGANPLTLFIAPANAPNSGQIRFSLPIALASGDTLVIDCDPRNRSNAVTLNGGNALYLIGVGGITNTIGDDEFFPYIDPGATNVVNTSVSAVVTWRDAWAL